MKTQNEIEYEINFIKNELVNRDFKHLTEDELKVWESALNWVLKTDEQLTWSELAELTHETQVAKFNWCMCEDNEGQENPYTDCPKTGE